jgi:outer membrane protein OmpA-like peptidoglycan-associated protein
MFPILGYSQISVSGLVKDKNTGTLIENAIVTLKPNSLSGAGYYSGKKTVKNGAFTLSTNYNYPIQLITTKKGCQTKKIKIKKGDSYVEVIIKCDSESIKEIIKEQTSDIDNDGVLDRDDKCINQAGEIDNNGCPWADDDKDGVPNKDDDCLNEAGPKENNGCPKEPTDFIEFINSEINKFSFLAASSRLDSGDILILEMVKELLDKYPKTSITIEGHASSEGSSNYNQKLSEQRAITTKEYLISKSIDAKRLNIIGYGESQTIGDNKTAKGRADSRRVKFKLDL